jgi:predicted TPR repeat methyltransferase
MAGVGYRHPTICLALLARHLPAGAGPVLDAGAGTGIIGEWLKILGYGPVEGVDLSPGMLEVAARVDDLAAEGAVQRVDETPPYSSMPGVEDNGTSRVIVLRRT